MVESKLLQEISNKEIDKEEIANRVIKNPDLLSEIFEGLNAGKVNIKYGCDKILRIIIMLK